MKHIVNVTISNPSHDFISMRRRQSTTNYMVEARDEAEAIFRASNHFKKLGHYVHNAVIVEQNLNEEETGDHSAVNAFAAHAHEQWRKGFDPENSGKERVKKNSDGSEGNINVPFHKLHPDWQKENLAAGRAAHEAVTRHPDDMEKAAEHVHNEWMKRNPKADYNAHQHVPYSDLPEDEKQKDRDHINVMKNLLSNKNEEVEQIDEAPSQTDIERGIKAYHGSHSPGGSIRYHNILGKFAKKYSMTPHEVHKHIEGEAKHQKEEVEQIDELKKSTLASYIKKAAPNIRTSHSLAASFDDDHTAAIRKVLKNSPNVDPHKGHIRNPAEKRQGELEMKATADLRDKFKRRATNRITGIQRAARRLAKEEVEQIDEAPLANLQQIRRLAKGGGVSASGTTALQTAMAHLKRVGGDVNKLQPRHRRTLSDFNGHILNAVVSSPTAMNAALRNLKSESVEQIDELSKDFLTKKYGPKAMRAHLAAKAAGKRKKANKRAAGVNLASAKAYPDQYKNSPNKAKVPATNEEVVNEKAPPGAKYERMVKHIKAKYSEDGTLTDKEKAIAYATAWKAKNAGK